MEGPAAAAALPAGPGHSGLCWRGCRSPTGTPPGPCTPAGSCRHRRVGSCPRESGPGKPTVGGLPRCSHPPASSLYPCLFQILQMFSTQARHCLTAGGGSRVIAWV